MNGQGRHFLAETSQPVPERRGSGKGWRQTLAQLRISGVGGSRGGDVGVRFYIYREECFAGV